MISPQKIVPTPDTRTEPSLERDPPPTHSSQPPKFPYLTALRPRQWTKNLIVFAAPLFAFKLTPQTLWFSLQAYVLFCCISSAFYLINDLVDVKSDRLHPVKCQRPIAAGLVPVPAAWAMAIALIAIALLGGWHIQSGLGVAIAGYAILQALYNLKLKHVVILDVVAIALGFVLRAYAGAAATQITLSAWFILCTAMLAMFLGLEKRKAELRAATLRGRPGRAVLQRYSLNLLERIESTVTAATLGAYSLWSAGPQLNGASTPWMMATIPFVLYGLFRYQLLSDPQEVARRGEGGQVRGGKTERPEEVLLTDKPLLFTVFAWIGVTVAVLWLKQRGWL